MNLSKELLESMIILMSKKGAHTMENMNSTPETVIEQNNENEFSINTMLGVALIGAASSAVMYYIYTQLSKETKGAIREMVMGSIKNKLHDLTKKP